MTGCTYETAGLVCGAPDARQYLTGYCCVEHAPWAIAGRPDPDLAATPEPNLGAQPYVYRRNDTALIDDRARKSGKRASGQQRRASYEGST